MGAVRPPLRRHRRGGAAGGSRAGGAVRLPPGHVVARDRRGARGRGAGLHHPVLLAPARRQVARPDGQGRGESGRGRHRDARGAVHHDHPARRAGAHRRQRPQGIALGTVHARLHGADRAAHGVVDETVAAGAGGRGVGRRSRAAARRLGRRGGGGGRAPAGAGWRPGPWAAGGWGAGQPQLAPLFTHSATTLTWIMVAYGFIASVLPVWMLLCPRDYLSTFLKVTTILVRSEE